MSAPPTNPVARQLHIKLGVVQRTAKELAAYQAELITNREKVAAMRARGADEYDIKKQVEVLGETETMIPDTMRRLARGTDDLRAFIAASGGEAAIAGSEQLSAARALLAAADASEGAAGGGAEGDEDEAI